MKNITIQYVVEDRWTRIDEIEVPDGADERLIEKLVNLRLHELQSRNELNHENRDNLGSEVVNVFWLADSDGLHQVEVADG
jgi:hypothetical protein